MKKLLVLILGTLMVFSLASCGGAAASSAAPAASSAAPAASSAAPAASSSAPAVSSSAPANNYPNKPITIIVPYTAGGATDTGARLMAQYLPKYLPGSTFVVENQAGGAAVPGTLAMRTAKPDGYTIGYNFYASWIFRPQMMDTGYTYKDFRYIAGIIVHTNGIFVRADSKYQTVEDLIKDMKENPGKLNYSCGTANASQDLSIAVLREQAGNLDAVSVPYEGASQARLGLIAGDLDFAALEVATCTAELKAGTVRCLAVLENERNMLSLPNVPTIGEAGYPDVAKYTQQRCVINGPAELSDDIVNTLSAAFKKVCEDKEFIEKMNKANFVVQFADEKTVTKEITDNYPIITPIIKKYFS